MTSHRFLEPAGTLIFAALLLIDVLTRLAP
jgi:hypothetical protein